MRQAPNDCPAIAVLHVWNALLEQNPIAWAEVARPTMTGV
jgi:hypothetical protein